MMLWAPGAQAQSGARSLHAIGTGGGASPLGSPTSSLFMNPAHLAVGDERTTFEVRIADVRASGGGDLFQFARYNETLSSDRQLSRSEVDEQLDEWFGEQMRSGLSYASFVPVSFSYQPANAQWAVGGGVRFRGMTKTSVNRGFLDLLLRGTGQERSIPMNGEYTAFSTVDVTGAFGYTFRSTPLSVGIAPRLIFGTGYADGRLNSEVTVTPEAVIHKFAYTARAAGSPSTEVYDEFDAFAPSPWPTGATVRPNVSGIGGGVDLGATYELQPGLYVSMNVTDLGFIRWTSAAQTVTPAHNEFRFEGVELDLERLRNEFDGEVLDYVKHQVDSLAQAVYQDVERDRSAFSTALPTALHVNGTWREGRYTVNGGASLGLNSSGGAVSSSPSVYAGGEVRLGPVPLRAGVRLGGSSAVAFAGGFGLRISGYRFDLGGSVTPSTSLLGKGAHYAVGLSLSTVRF